MRIEVSIYKKIKKLSLIIPGLRNLFFKFESYIFDIFKIIDFRQYIGKSFRPKKGPNEDIIMKFKKFYEKNFFDEKINSIIDFAERKIKSAWQGHQYFAIWLVKELQPLTIVDLGVATGFSTLIFAAQNVGKVYGIDWFKRFSPLRRELDDYIPCMRNKKKLEKKFGIKNVTIIRAKFSEVAKKWNIPIDILHIDGSHEYKDVKEDYQIWSKFLNKNGVFLFHDINEMHGAKQFFNELELPKYSFLHSYGLGIMSKNKELISRVKKIWNI